MPMKIKIKNPINCIQCGKPIPKLRRQQNRSVLTCSKQMKEIIPKLVYERRRIKMTFKEEILKGQARLEEIYDSLIGRYEERR